MVQQYHSQIEFEDPAFGKLSGDKAKNMWRMLCKSSSNLEISYTFTNIVEEKVKANWEAKYVFSKTGRKIHNKIFAEFEIKDGKIIKHKDKFNLYYWAIQAFGVKGVLVGWSPMFKSKLNKETNKLLEIFVRKNRLS